MDDKSNEITAILELLRMLVITGCIITTDALGCQVEVDQTCVDQQADYVLALKENQENLYQDIKVLTAKRCWLVSPISPNLSEHKMRFP